MTRFFLIVIALIIGSSVNAQLQSQAKSYTQQDTLRGSLGEGRTWWDVQHYAVYVEPDYEKKSIQGKVDITVKILSSGTKMQIDLQQPMQLEKAYWGDVPKTFFMSGRMTQGQEQYTPNKVWQTDYHYVAYSAAGSDVNNLIVGLGQRLGTGLMSKESAREADPLISDPDFEHDRIIAEGVEDALLASIQQQAANPQGPYQPEDLAYLVKLVVENDEPLFDAVRKTDERARERQAAEMPMGAPETMPGLAMPGMGAEAPVGAPAGAPPLEELLAQLGG